MIGKLQPLRLYGLSHRRGGIAVLPVVVLMVALCLPGFANADLDTLVRDGHVYTDTTIEPSGELVPGQRIRLIIEVGTDTWFTGGTRITVPEVPGLVILQNEQFASNASEIREGKTWVIQRWSLDVFAQRPGEFTIPAIRLQLAVNGNRMGEVSGSLRTPPGNLTVSMPAPLASVDSWVAAPEFTVEQQFSRDETNLQVGDAVEREITFEASDVMAMMLPAVAPAAPARLAAYPEPPVLDNSINRGQLSASRIERTTFVAEAPGEFDLPEQTFYWWNTQTKSLETLTLPAISLSVEGALVAEEQRSQAVPQRLLKPAAILLATIAAAAFVTWLAGKVPWSKLLVKLQRLAGYLRALREPALPARLNPGSDQGRGRIDSGSA